jgi:hypothetical protein
VRSHDPHRARQNQTKASLTPARRRLLELFQQINFGRIESLEVRNREPVLDPKPRVIREIKFHGENGPRPELYVDDFVLKDGHLEFFEFLDRLQDGVIESITVKGGLPFHLFVVDAA